MASALDTALQRALSIRLNLQVSLSMLPIVEEWMDIHLDRWLEHNPMPPDMPDGEEVHYLAMLGTDLRRLWWGAWGDPRGFVPRMAEYFKLCNIARSDEAILDQAGVALEPGLVGSWIGVWGKKVTTGWHFCDPQPWARIEAMFGTHEAKYQLKKWVEDHQVAHVQRFTQSIGEAPYSELVLAVPGASLDDQLAALSGAFAHFTGAPLAAPLLGRLREVREVREVPDAPDAPPPRLGLSVRVRGGKVVRVGGMAPAPAGVPLEAVCADAEVAFDARLPRLVGGVGDGAAMIEYARAGDRAGLDVYLDPARAPRPAGSAPVPPAAN